MFDSEPRLKVTSAGYCEPYLAIYDDKYKKTIVYHVRSNNKILVTNSRSVLMTGAEDFFMLDQSIYQVDEQGHYRNIASLSERLPVTCAAIIQ